MLLGTMSRTFPEIFSLLLICLRYKANAPVLLFLHRNSAVQSDSDGNH